MGVGTYYGGSNETHGLLMVLSTFDATGLLQVSYY
jgi:hypothetical protein